MNYVTLNLQIAGVWMLVLSIAHVIFARHLGWKQDVAKLTPINRQIFFVHAFFICLVLAMMGLLSLCCTQTLTTPTPLARLVLSGMMLFWTVRLVFQWCVYDWSHWRGQRLHTVVHFAFTALWSYFIATFAMALRVQFV